MSKYFVSVRVKYTGTVEVNAATDGEALAKAEDMVERKLSPIFRSGGGDIDALGVRSKSAMWAPIGRKRRRR